MVNARPYQEKALEAINKAFESGDKTLINMATGTGKTFVFCSLAKDFAKDNKNVLMLAHRTELLMQPKEMLKEFFDTDSGIEKGIISSEGENIVIASVQSLKNSTRLSKFWPNYFDLIIVDECHHATSGSYKTILDNFTDYKLLGVTATPFRSDKKNLLDVFESVAFEYSIEDGIRDGFLSPIKIKVLPLTIDLRDAEPKGDFKEEYLDTKLDPYLQEIANIIFKNYSGRKILIFCPLIFTAQKLSKYLQTLGLNADWVSGERPDREEIINSYKNNEIDILCNSMLLTEGFDCPQVDCIINLRATKSLSLYQQIIGRGTRISPNKDDLLILDFLWLSKEHALCTPASLLAKDEREERKIQDILDSGGTVDLIETKEEVEEAIQQEEDEIKKELRKIEFIKKTEDRISERLKSHAKEERRFKRLKSIKEVAGILGDDTILNFDTDDKRPLTDKQIDTLINWGINPKGIINLDHAKHVINRWINYKTNAPLTQKQYIKLKEFGFKNPEKLNANEARREIGKIAKNGWRVTNEQLTNYC